MHYNLNYFKFNDMYLLFIINTIINVLYKYATLFHIL